MESHGAVEKKISPDGQGDGERHKHGN